MQVPPQIVLKDLRMTPRIEQLLTRGIAKLEQTCDYITSARIALEQVQGRHVVGNPYRMRIDIRIADRPEIVVKRFSKGLKKIPGGLALPQTTLARASEPDAESSEPAESGVHRRGIREEPLMALIGRTFDSAQRELERVVDKQRGAVKMPAPQQETAVVEKIFRDQDYGFLRTANGEEVYFSRNSVLHQHWDRLTVGTVVRYVLEEGEKGLQASTVEPLAKPGASEFHDQLHELPEIPVVRRKTPGHKRQKVNAV